MSDVEQLDAWAWPGLPPRRELPKKPCRWCVDRFAMPATHVAVWPRVELEDGDGGWWMPPKRVRMCAFHARFAQRRGARVYRFRKV